MATMASAPSPALFPSLPPLRKEIKQCKMDIQILPFPPKREKPQALYFLREVPLGGKGTGFVDIPLTSSKFQELKKELKRRMNYPHLPVAKKYLFWGYFSHEGKGNGWRQN